MEMETPALKSFRLYVKTLTGGDCLGTNDINVLLHLAEEIAKEAPRLEREIAFYAEVADAMEHEERDLYRRWYEKMRDLDKKHEESPEYNTDMYQGEMSDLFRQAEEEREKLGDAHGRLKARICERDDTRKRRRKDWKESYYGE